MRLARVVLVRSFDMHAVPRALQRTIVHARPPPPMRGFLIELSDQATMIGDLSGLVRAWTPPDPRYDETKLFVVEKCGFVQEPKPPPPPAESSRSAWLAAACGFFGVLAFSAPLLLHLFF